VAATDPAVHEVGLNLPSEVIVELRADRTVAGGPTRTFTAAFEDFAVNLDGLPTTGAPRRFQKA
jgi:hypothetical protein